MQANDCPESVLMKERGPPVRVVITGRPHDIASRNTCPKGPPTEGPPKTPPHHSPSGGRTCPPPPHGTHPHPPGGRGTPRGGPDPPQPGGSSTSQWRRSLRRSSRVSAE